VPLRTLPPGVHRLALSAEGGSGTGSDLPVTLELADRVTGGLAGTRVSEVGTGSRAVAPGTADATGAAVGSG
jgi:hypothetical protein